MSNNYLDLKMKLFAHVVLFRLNHCSWNFPFSLVKQCCCGIFCYWPMRGTIRKWKRMKIDDKDKEGKDED